MQPVTYIQIDRMDVEDIKTHLTTNARQKSFFHPSRCRTQGKCHTFFIPKVPWCQNALNTIPERCLPFVH